MAFALHRPPLDGIEGIGRRVRVAGHGPDRGNCSDRLRRRYRLRCGPLADRPRRRSQAGARVGGPKDPTVDRRRGGTDAGSARAGRRTSTPASATSCGWDRAPGLRCRRSYAPEIVSRDWPLPWRWQDRDPPSDRMRSECWKGHLRIGNSSRGECEKGPSSPSPPRSSVPRFLRSRSASSTLFWDTAASQSVRLEHRSDPSDLPVIADRDRTLQVLSNIVANAIKFTPPLGRIEVTARRDEAGAVRISVSDTGPGISFDELPHVFERFWKASTDRRTGTGLGLHIAGEIVAAQRGQIWPRVGREPGQPSTSHSPRSAPCPPRQPRHLRRRRRCQLPHLSSCARASSRSPIWRAAARGRVNDV